MRMRRNQNRPFRRGGHNSNKPRRMEGLPADEPDLPPPGMAPAVPSQPAAAAGPVPGLDPTANPGAPTEAPLQADLPVAEKMARATLAFWGEGTPAALLRQLDQVCFP